MLTIRSCLGALIFSLLSLPAGPGYAQDKQNDLLFALNTARAKYGARPVSWAAEGYTQALNWAKLCKGGHSDAASRYGESLYVGTGTPSYEAAVTAWMSQAAKYDYNNPVYSLATGDFTEVVWKSVTKVTGAIAPCPAGTLRPEPTFLVVVRYYPPGNYPGQYSQNVGRPSR